MRVEILAGGKQRRHWSVVSDVARKHGIAPSLFGGRGPPAALFYYSRTRAGEYPRAHLAGWTGIIQADAFAGFNELYDTRRQPAPIIEAACWSHGRRKFFNLAKLMKAPIACEAVRRIDELFEIRTRNQWRVAGSAAGHTPRAIKAARPCP